MNSLEKPTGLKASTLQTPAGRPYERAVVWGVAGLCVLVPLTFSLIFSDYATPKLVLLQVGAALLGALMLAGMVMDGEVFVLDSPLNYVLLGFLAVNFVSLFQSYNVWQGFYTLFQYTCYFLILLLILHTVRHRSDLLLLAGVMTATGGLVALIGLLQHNKIFHFYHAWSLPVSTIGNVNFVAEYYNVVFPVALSMLVVPRRTLLRAGALIACFLMACHLIVLGSRGGWLGVVVTACVMGGALGVRHFQVGRKAIDFSVAALVVVALGWPVTREATAAIPIGGGRTVADLVGDYWVAVSDRTVDALRLRDNSSRQRVLLWEDTVSLILDRPLVGVGVGNYEFNIPRYMSQRSLEVKQAMEGGGTELMAFRAHNEYLEVWAETGVLGFAIFGYLLFLVGRAVLRLVRRYVRGEEDELALGLAAAFAATLVHAFFSTNLQDPSSALLFWVAVGMIWQLQRNGESDSRLGLLVTDGGQFAFGLLAATFVGAAAVVWFGVSLLVGDYHYFRGLRSFDREDYVSAESELVKAVDYRPPKPFAAYELLGKSRYNRGDYPGAEAALSKALLYHRNSAAVYHVYGQTVGHQGRIAEGLPALSRAVELNPLRTKYRVSYGIGLSLAGQNNRAISELEEAEAQDPTHADASFHLGGSFRRAGRLDEAGEAFARALSIDPGNEEYQNSAAVLAMQRGKMSEAEDAFRKLGANNPGRPDYRFNLAVVLYSQGRIRASAESLGVILQTHADFEPARRFLSEMFEVSGDTVRARVME